MRIFRCASAAWRWSTRSAAADGAGRACGAGFFAALGRGWNVTKDNLGNMIVMGVILTVGGFVVGFVIGLPQLFSLFPLFTGLISGTFLTDFEALVRGISAVVVLQLIYLPIYLGLRSVLISYIESAWVLTYLEKQLLWKRQSL